MSITVTKVFSRLRDHDEKGSTYMLEPYAALSWKPHPHRTFNGGLHALYLGLNDTYNHGQACV
ncbi:MAG: hypothetical protein KI786_08305 [Mameliella sp.]|nr:hypothetical protein [Phaeodactylibacter sp.]NRA52388.1 hypothetical protein [Phaeodactylibacter sp.]